MQLLEDYALVREIPVEESAGILVAVAPTPKHAWWTVVHCGPGRLSEPTARRVRMPCVAGQQVFLRPNEGVEVTIDGEPLRLIFARDIVAVRDVTAA